MRVCGALRLPVRDSSHRKNGLFAPLRWSPKRRRVDGEAGGVQVGRGRLLSPSLPPPASLRHVLEVVAVWKFLPRASGKHSCSASSKAGEAAARRRLWLTGGTGPSPFAPGRKLAMDGEQGLLRSRDDPSWRRGASVLSPMPWSPRRSRLDSEVGASALGRRQHPVPPDSGLSLTRQPE